MAKRGGAAETGMPFTTDRYVAFLEELLDEGHSFVGFGEPGSGEVVVRHDVDICPKRALAMARAEADLGVESTYFFLVGSPAYDLLDADHRRAVERIEALGHDVGLHFDVHRHWDERPDDETLAAQVRGERRSLAALTSTPVDTVSFHVPPEWALGAAFDGFTNAYEPRYFTDIEYVSDSNQKWRRGHPFPDGVPETVQILVHPGLWYERDRTLSDILDGMREDAHADVEQYMSLLGE